MRANKVVEPFHRSVSLLKVDSFVKRSNYHEEMDTSSLSA